MSGDNAKYPQSERETAAIDALDRRILARWQNDTRRAAERIGEEIGLSAAAVQRRLKRLRANGVIEHETATLNAHALGYPVTCLVGVDLLQERNEHIKAFKQSMLKLPEVQQCYYVTGEYDFILVVVCRDLSEYEHFTQQSIMSDDNVRSFTTWVTLDKVKTSVRLPLTMD
jgi:DNA-binding Lrp family transcriptional regulator